MKCNLNLQAYGHQHYRWPHRGEPTSSVISIRVSIRLNIVLKMITTYLLLPTTTLVGRMFIDRDTVISFCTMTKAQVIAIGAIVASLLSPILAGPIDASQAGCAQDNLLRALLNPAHTAEVASFCNDFLCRSSSTVRSTLLP